MPKRVLFNLLYSVFLLTFLLTAAVFAQTNSCANRMEVTRSNSKTKINGAAATALNTDTKRIYKSVLRSGMPYFAKLPGGNYRVTVSKIGYKRSVDEYFLDCSEANTKYAIWSIELYAGSSAKTVRLYNRTEVLKAPPLKRAEASEYSIGSVNMGRYDPNTKSETTSGSKTDGYSVEPNTPKTISGGVVNGKATNLVKPPYPAAAKAVRASGAVNVQVTIDEQGNVISAFAVSGHPLLRAAAVQAARASTFSPTLLMGQPVKVTGIIVYNFVP